MDWVLATRVLLLTAILGAFLLELTPYTVCAALLLVLFILRLKKVNLRQR